MRTFTQALSLLLFSTLFVFATYKLPDWLPADIYLRLDPLLGLNAVFAAREVIGRALWSLILIGATLIIGRFFCAYVCPTGASIDFLDFLFLRKKKRRGLKAEVSFRKVKYFLLIIFVVWTTFWSFLSRLVTHSFRFMTHLAVSGIASVAFFALVIAVEYLEFLFSWPTAARVVDFVGLVIVFSLLLYTHLSVMSEFSRWKRLLSSILISAAILSIVLLIRYTKGKEFSTELQFSSVIKPIGRTWVRTVSSNEFFGDLRSLKARIDALAQEGPRKKVVKEE